MKNIFIVYVYKNVFNWKILVYIFFFLWKVVKSFIKIVFRKLIVENDIYVYIIIC